jgi:nicotinate-nucleotide adenylyltransferase
MRVALFGGSFDPPHVGHQLACLYVLLTYPVDEVWMVPVFRHAFDKRSAPFVHRVAMCERAAAAIGTAVRVSTIEQELAGPSYTLLTVRALKERHPEHDFALVIGTDLIKERERWYGWPELAQLVPFLVLGRGGVAREKGALPTPGQPYGQPHDQLHEEGIELPEVCSTAVRARLGEGKLPHGWVARAVLSYIREQGLYRATTAAAPAPGPESASPGRSCHRPELPPEAAGDEERGSK